MTDNNVLVISDLHLPFTQDGYLEHCKAVYKKYKCNKVVFIGDLIDNHYTSYHDTNPDGLSAKGELDAVKSKLKLWYKAFPKAYVCWGNHDRLILRKAFSSGISKDWIKDFPEMLNTPNWVYADSFEFNKVLYIHGEGSGNILNTILHKRQSTVCGHLHSKFEIVYSASRHDLLFGMHVGCGIDIKQYAFEYNKDDLKRPIIGCGVVLENGTLPILIPFNY